MAIDLNDIKQRTNDLIDKASDVADDLSAKAKPLTDGDKCIGCGTCANVCSMGSIDPSDVTSVPGICIKCQACVTHCPKDARYFDDPDFLSHVRMLESICVERAENKVWI